MNTSLTRFSLYVIARNNDIRRKKEKKKKTTIKDKSLAGHSDLIQLSISFLFFFFFACQFWSLFFLHHTAVFLNGWQMFLLARWESWACENNFNQSSKTILRREYVRDDEDDWRNGKVTWDGIFVFCLRFPKKETLRPWKIFNVRFSCGVEFLTFNATSEFYNRFRLESASIFMLMTSHYFFRLSGENWKNQVEVCGRIKKRKKPVVMEIKIQTIKTFRFTASFTAH